MRGDNYRAAVLCHGFSISYSQFDIIRFCHPTSEPSENVDPSLNASTRSYYSAAGLENFVNNYGLVPVRPADTIPVVFNQPVLPSSVSNSVFEVTLSDGTVLQPITTGLLPNVEYNERQTVVLIGYWGNRVPSDKPGALYPVQVTIVDNPANPLILLGPQGFTNATGITMTSRNSYDADSGPQILTAKLNTYTQLGEGCPIWTGVSFKNSGEDLYGDDARYRIRLFISNGFSPDGIASIFPTEFSKYFYLTAVDEDGKMVKITETGVKYKVKGYGKLQVVGLADCGLNSSSYNAAYVEDHDNQYDIILRGNPKAIQQIRYVTMPSSGAYSPVYNPGGPGNAPETNPPTNWTVPSSYHQVEVVNDVESLSYVTYVEVNGTVARNAQGQPVGRLLGPAVVNRRTGYVINAYEDPTGRWFYASFPVQSPCFGI